MISISSSFRPALWRRQRFVDAPIGHALIEAGAEDDAIANPAGNAQRFRSLGGNIDRHRALADFQLHVAARALAAFRHIDAAAVQQIANPAQADFKIGELGRGASQL